MIIQNLDPKKGQGRDEISIRMLKLGSTLICKSMGTLQNDWRMLFLSTKKVIKKFSKTTSDLAMSCVW